MNCIICGHNQLDRRNTSVVLERKDTRLVVDSVPSSVCAGCGEVYVDEIISYDLLKLAEKAVLSGIRRGTWKFGDGDDRSTSTIDQR
jgi:YgiT-type zinc finger domain-containing protein